MKTEKQIAADAARFAERWRGKGDEKSDSQPFWLDLLANVTAWSKGCETPIENCQMLCKTHNRAKGNR